MGFVSSFLIFIFLSHVQLVILLLIARLVKTPGDLTRVLPDVNQDYAEQHQGLYSFYLPIKLARTGPTDALGQQMVQGTCHRLLACFFR